MLSERFRVRVTEGALAERGYLAGDDDLRAEELDQLLRDPDVRAIIPAKGGYGITRILDRLDAATLRDDPKLVVGFSDGTALLCWALAVAGVRGIHGPMAASLGERPVPQQQHLLDLLEGKPVAGPIPCAGVGGAAAAANSLSSGRYEGRLLGGNMTVLSATVGTAYQIGFADALLFIEDIGKLPSTLDRLLTHLRAANVLAGVKAALLGELLSCTSDPTEPEPPAHDVVSELMKEFEIPLLRGLPVGHGSDNWALPFGGRAVMDLGRRELTLLEGAVG